MNAAELAEIKAEHHGTGFQPNRCVACGRVVPCRALRLVARVEELEKENAALKREHQGFAALMQLSEVMVREAEAKLAALGGEDG